jgi:hypothetical protein
LLNGGAYKQLFFFASQMTHNTYFLPLLLSPTIARGLS